MAAVRNVPEMAREKMTIRSRHRVFLKSHFQDQKETSKLLNDAFYAMFRYRIKQLPWSDPAPKPAAECLPTLALLRSPGPCRPVINGGVEVPQGPDLGEDPENDLIAQFESESGTTI